MKINVVMLVYNRPELTEQAVWSLYAHNDYDRFTLTVVDDGSDAATKEVLERLLIRPGYNNVDLIHQDNCGITARVRNHAIGESQLRFGRGDFLYLSDNDVFFESHSLLEMATTMFHLERTEPHISLLGGSNHPYHQPIKRINISSKAAVNTHMALAGYSQMMRWKTWDKYGPLKEGAPGVRQGEDSDFCGRIYMDGGLICSMDPEVVLACGITDSFGQPIIGAELMPRYPGVLQV